MAMAIQSNENSRFTDLADEPVDHLLAPIRGYEDKPLVPLAETITAISGFFNNIQDYAFVALHNSQNPADNLTQQESASVHLYTMQFHGGPSLYTLLNQSLRAENREDLKPWFSFLKLFLTALYKLPSHSQTVWRGIKNVDLSSKYKKGTKFVWWGVSSCTTDLEVLESKHFLGKQGLRTLFSIECINGKSISNHSYFKTKEKEIILIPGSYFEVIGKLDSGSELHIIQLKDITLPITLFKPPFSQSINLTSSSSVSNESNSGSSPSSNNIKQHEASNIIAEEIPFKSNAKWKQQGIIVAGGHGHGKQLNQLFYPYGICIDDDQTLFIADHDNHRIMQWKANEHHGRVVAGENGEGNQKYQLNGPKDVILDQETNSLIVADLGNRRVVQWSRQNPTKHGQILLSNIISYGLTMDRKGSLYVSDLEKHEVRRWERGEKEGTIVAGGNGKGGHLNQLHFPSSVFVDEDESLYVSDKNNRRVMKWMKDAREGRVVAGGNGQGQWLTQLSSPSGVIVDSFGQIYVADFNNDRVMRWHEGEAEGTIIVGENGTGNQSNQLCGPTGLSFDRQGNLYVVDRRNHRIQKFEMDFN